VKSDSKRPFGAASGIGNCLETPATLNPVPDQGTAILTESSNGPTHLLPPFLRQRGLERVVGRAGLLGIDFRHGTMPPESVDTAADRHDFDEAPKFPIEVEVGFADRSPEFDGDFLDHILAKIRRQTISP